MIEAGKKMSITDAENLKRIRLDFSNSTSSQTARILRRFPDWFQEYNACVIERLGLLEDKRNLCRVYGRAVDFHFPSLREFSNELKACLQACFFAGWYSTITIPLSQLVGALDDLTSYLGDGLLGGVTIVVKDDNLSRPSLLPLELDNARRALKALRESGVSLTLVGSIAAWESITLGVHNDITSLTIVTGGPRAARRKNCFGFVQCFIRSDGAIFPCIALREVEAAAIGSIFDSPRCIDSPLLAQLSQWAIFGPPISAHLGPSARATGEMCKVHAQEIVLSLRGD